MESNIDSGKFQGTFFCVRQAMIKASLEEDLQNFTKKLGDKKSGHMNCAIHALRFGFLMVHS